MDYICVNKCPVEAAQPDHVCMLVCGPLLVSCQILDYWGPSKKLLGDINFLKDLREYDRDNIPVHIIKKIRDEYKDHPEFDPNKVRQASSAAEGLCKWVKALEVYDRVAKVVAPKKEKLKVAEKELAETMALLDTKRAELKEVGVS